ncbi:D-alanyl-D-alanine carboxypeptidase [Oceanisphaera avium]|uniref:D-alanyl-D-alanine carboxypeptidase n=1 Tax=Oceanisphaera avium TaxID=1903694 RepID=A0A1Y0CZN6_9GAMM|nr:D-alanyl-D-alanine carboxypeptidase [Oceanisphaera avium]ART80779.1 D-alanyl-D-alanine carboxypeptidase [Oceanisphaera avium]
MLVAKGSSAVKWLLAMVLMCSTISVAQAQTNPRYAAIVVNAHNGEVLHAEYADAARYPASLTKMMTLYLLFEAMDNKLLTLDTAMPVSAHAASMPQTNISLKKGDKLRVRDAIPALIVRSANDAAVVVGEAIGGTESHFAELMTRKAKALNMKSTTFRNASGLPNSGQKTTARDLSILSMRLMKDHAKYYHYFATPSFTYGGRIYHSHNRLIKNYPGTDGMKTGYINASGFNVATSTKKGPHRLVGVVMGGRTSQSRDAAMAKLLDKSFIKAEQIAKVSPTGAQQAAKEVRQDKAASKLVISSQTVRQVTRQPASKAPSTHAPKVVSNNELDKPAPVTQVGVPEIKSTERKVTQLAQAPTFTKEQTWAIQVGSFRAMEQARDRAAEAAKRLGNTQQAKIAVNEASVGGQTLYRAQLVGLAQDEAKQSCEHLVRQSMDCLVVRM